MVPPIIRRNQHGARGKVFTTRISPTTARIDLKRINDLSRSNASVSENLWVESAKCG
jgi:hypothetical protein